MGRYTGKIRNLVIPVTTRDMLKDIAQKNNCSMGSVVTEIAKSIWLEEFGGKDKLPSVKIVDQESDVITRQ